MVGVSRIPGSQSRDGVLIGGDIEDRGATLPFSMHRFLSSVYSEIPPHAVMSAFLEPAPAPPLLVALRSKIS